MGSSRVPARARRLAPRLLAPLACLSLLVGVLALYAERSLFDSRNFADRATSALDEPEVKALIGAKVADGVIRAEPDLIGAKPLIEGAATAVVGTAAFQEAFKRAVGDVHVTMFERDSDTVALKLADVGLLIVQGLHSVAPQVARRIPPSVDTGLVSVSEGGAVLRDIAQIGEDVRALSGVFLALAALLVAAAIALSGDRRRTVTQIGAGVAVVGILGVIAFEVARAVLMSKVTAGGDRDAVAALFDAFFFDLRTWTLLLTAMGVVLTAAAASLLRPLDVPATLRRTAALVSRVPASPWLRTLRAVALVALGLLIVVERDAMLRLAVVMVGILVVFAGVSELLRISLPASPPERPVRRLRGVRPEWRRVARVALVCAAAVAILAGAAVAADDPEDPPIEIRACNGHAELCDRPLEEISFPSTHNSMSAADQPGWLFAAHERAIPSQLRAGIRGLLIDTHDGVRTDKGVYTLLEGGTKSRQKLVGSVGEDFVRTAERLRGRLGYKGGGDPEVYFCHAYCEVGATRATTALGWIRDFLVAHPHEVLLVSIEDDVSPERTAKVFADSGLLDYVYKGPLDPLPTPRQLIERGEPVIVMSEERTGDVPWLRQQFALVQETPFEFTSRAALEAPASCERNRGKPSNPMLLLNNWVDTSPAPKPSNARRVNARAALLARARRCQRAFDRLPNLVAVDFYKEGDVTGVSDVLNGVGR